MPALLADPGHDHGPGGGAALRSRPHPGRDAATDAARQNAAELRTFNDDLDSINFPSDTNDEVDAVSHATDKFIADFEALSKATSLQDYANIATGSFSSHLVPDRPQTDDASRMTVRFRFTGRRPWTRKTT